jgi:cytochrome c peroxidase
VQLKAAIALIAAAAGGLTAGAPAQAPGAPRQATAEAPPQDAAGAPRQDIAGDAAPPFYTARFEKSPSAAQMSALGRALFRDPALSASGRIACATCHSPSHAFGPPDGAPVRRGGVDGRRPGVRTVPSLRYLQSVPPWSEHAFDEETGADQGPTGGLTWDGRAPSAHEQARVPLLSPYEMANASIGAVAAAVRRSAHAAQFRDAFGANIFGDPALAFQAVLLALETYQQDPAEFYPYSSKYDAWLRRQASLTDQELEGLAAFNDPARGNCARCHPSAVRDGAFPQFTDFGYAGIGAPRNSAIPANADPRHFDLGLCGPLRADLAARAEYCGLFRTPTLRNAALRRVFFHNGVLHRLEDVVRFYAERDTRPERWYPRAPGGPLTFDDLPPGYRGNLEQAAPFGRRVGDPPALGERDVAAIVAFLNTLTDGYRP